MDSKFSVSKNSATFEGKSKDSKSIDTNSVDKLIDRVSCSLHGKKSISVNSSTYEIFCSDCHPTSEEKNDKESADKANGTLHVTCYEHISDDGSFYCLDCNDFICCKCIASNHRNHVSSVHDELRGIIREKLSNLSRTLELLGRNIVAEDVEFKALNEVICRFRKELNNKNDHLTELIKDSVNKKNKDIKDSLSDCINIEDEKTSNITYMKGAADLRIINSFFDDFEDITDIIDRKFEYNSLNPLSLKSKKNNIIQITERLNPLRQICDKLSDALNKEAEDIERLNARVNLTKKTSEEMVDWKTKDADSVFNTLYRSLVTSEFPKSIYLRRFARFFNPGTMYFKNDSLCFECLSDHNVNMTGLGICGLLQTHEKSTLSLELKISRQLTQRNRDRLEKQKKLPYEFSNKDYWEPLYKENIIIKEVEKTNKVNPIQTIFLQSFTRNTDSNTVLLESGYIYKINLKNIDSTAYCDIWNGRVNYQDFSNLIDPSDSSLKQNIECNMSDTLFKFTSSTDTDFNEFSNGLICDIIYSIN